MDAGGVRGWLRDHVVGNGMAAITVILAAIAALGYVMDLHADRLGAELGAQIEGLAAVMDERFNAVDQRFNAVDQRFNAVDRRLDALADRIEAVNAHLGGRIDELGARVDELGARVDELGARVGRVEQRLDRVDDRMWALGAREPAGAG